MKKLTLIVCALCVPFLVGCDFIWTSMTINYKVTVEIETPEGVRSGYAVRQISNATPLFTLPESGNPASIRGEAVVIDLGERGKVFALMSDQSWRNGLYQAFKIKGPATKKGVLHYRSLKIGEKSEWVSFKPEFVMFKDITDSTSVMLVRGEEHWNRDLDKSAAEDHFEQVLGQGVSLKNITVEITDEPVTWGMEKYLGRRVAVGPYVFVKKEQKK